MIVDCHVHLEYRDGRCSEKFNAKELVEAMDSGGIDISVILGNDQGDAGSHPPWADQRLQRCAVQCPDEEVASYCAQYPDRLVGFTSVHPSRYQVWNKVERAITEFGMRGLKLYPHSGFYPDDERLDPVYRTCERHGVPVMIHTGIKAVAWQSIKFNNPIHVDEVAVRHPGLKIIMCHGGYPWVEEFVTVAYSNPNILVDLTFMDYIERVFRRPGLVEDTVRRLYELIGPSRLMWGSEGPFMSLPLFGDHRPDYSVRSQHSLVRRFDFLNAHDKEKILGGNAAELLALHERRRS
jgi:predicted TIM-barrel fold metal-dependent hydrolase